MTTRRSCSVPTCTVTSTRYPEKYFFSSPSDEKRRELWLNRMNRDKKNMSPNTMFYVCEDHFDLEHDLENYIKFKYSKGRSIHLLKKNVVPHIFECKIRESESIRPNVSSQKSKARPAASKKTRKRLINEGITFSSEKNLEDAAFDQATEVPPFPLPKLPRNVQIQCNLQKKIKTRATQCTLLEDNSSYPYPECEVVIEEELSAEDSSFPAASEISEHSQTSTDSPLQKIAKKSDEMKNRETHVQYTLSLCRNKSRLYLGIDPAAFHIIDILCESLHCQEADVFIVLMKIRKNYSFEEIADWFGTTEPNITQKFDKMLPKICDCMKRFIKWPPIHRIKAALPIDFRLNYNDVQAIIDCFEIQIWEPSDPKLDASTWSEYKKANTMKYLIGSTPNGMIIYVSKGYGGGTSDLKIVEESGFLEMLPEKCCVMADRGFEGIESLLHPISCTLIRLPSVSAGLSKSTEEEALLTKQVTSLRIHQEQVMNRLHEFQLLTPLPSANNSSLKYLDQSMIAACGIINLQSELIDSE